MLRSSELVMKLNGSDAEQAADADGAYELVFGRSMGAPQILTLWKPVIDVHYLHSTAAMRVGPVLHQLSGSSLSRLIASSRSSSF